VALGSGSCCCRRLSPCVGASIRPSLRLRPPPHRTVQADLPHTAHRESVILAGLWVRSSWCALPRGAGRVGSLRTDPPRLTQPRGSTASSRIPSASASRSGARAQTSPAGLSLFEAPAMSSWALSSRVPCFSLGVLSVGLLCSAGITPLRCSYEPIRQALAFAILRFVGSHGYLASAGFLRGARRPSQFPSMTLVHVLRPSTPHGGSARRSRSGTPAALTEIGTARPPEF
jgi:hypothetical protein